MNEHLKNIDNYLKNQTPQNRVIISVFSGLLFLALIYFLVISDMQNEVDDLKDSREKKEKKLKALKANPILKKVKKTKKKIVELNAEKNQIARDIQKKNNSINSGSLFIIDDEAFSTYVRGFLIEANRLNIRLKSTQINQVKNPYIGLLSINKKLKISGNGEFLDILRFFRYIEEQNILIQADHIKIYKNDKGLMFEASFNVIGLS